MDVGEFFRKQQQKILTCEPDEIMEAIVLRLSKNNIGAMPVCRADGALVGVISERDLIRAIAADAEALSRRVRDLMTSVVVTCDSKTTMEEAERKMNEKRIRHLPVVEDGRVTAMLSIRDLVAWRVQSLRDDMYVLRDAMFADDYF
jgi:CBS domain-containing protein